MGSIAHALAFRFETGMNDTMEQGYVQVYTGNGKGKMPTALGLAMRAAGAGYQVFIGQFAKGWDYSDASILAL